MRIDLKDLLNGFWDNESGVESAFDCKDNSFEALDTDGRGAELHVRMHTLIASMAYST